MRASSAAFTAPNTALSVNFELTTKKTRQFFLDRRANQKPSRRTGFVTSIVDSPGPIGGRLEPQRGRSLTVKAVCGGTLGWKDPPFNSILALPGATHQDPTQNDIINDLISLNINFAYIQINSISKIMKVKSTKRPLRCYTTIGLIIRSLKIYIILNYLPPGQYIESGQATQWQKLRRQIFRHKNKMCRQTNDSRPLKKCAKYCEQCCHIFWQKNIVCRQTVDSCRYTWKGRNNYRIFSLNSIIS